VFVESQHVRSDQPPQPESTNWGSSSAFSTVVDGYRVTAVGEVPPETVRYIASQVKSQGPAAVGARGR
jgi:negative regulator of sigma E activity